MNPIGKFVTGSSLIVLVLCSAGSASAPTSPFDRFGDVNCEDEMARLDNFAIQLQHEPAYKGVIWFYGGRRMRGRLPRRGEAEARAARLKPYLVNRRGIPSNRFIVLNGGYAEEFKVVLLVVPPGAGIPTPYPIVPINKIKFRKGKARPRDYRYRI